VSFLLSDVAVGASDNLPAIAAFVLAGITLALVFATVWLVLSTRRGTDEARAATKAELEVLEHQVASSYRPLLVDVLPSAPVPDDMGALYDHTWSQGPNATAHEPGPVIETTLPGMVPRFFDPRTAFVLFQAGKIFLSVPLRNVGRGLAVIDDDGVELAGPLVGTLEHRMVQRRHVPAGETTRIDLITGAYHWENSYEVLPGRVMFGIGWQLAVPYLDFAGQQRTTAMLQIVCRGEQVDGPWLVERVDQEPLLKDELRIPELPVAAAQASGIEPQLVTDVWGRTTRRG
jgi:hypothetical protein